MWLVVRIIHSLISYVLTGIICILFVIPCCVLLLILPERWRYHSKLYYWLVHQFFYWGLKATLVPIRFIGLDNIPQDKAVIFAANHQSSLDIPLVGVLAQCHPHVWLAWSALINYPVLGFIVRRVAVLVDTSSPQKASRTLIQAINRIKENDHHVMIFPEGARFVDGKVHDFFSGFVILARRTGRPVVPVFIDNAYKVYPPHSLLIRWHPIRVIIGQPFEIKNGEQDEAFKQRVYAWFVAQQEK